MNKQIAWKTYYSQNDIKRAFELGKRLGELKATFDTFIDDKDIVSILAEAMTIYAEIDEILDPPLVFYSDKMAVHFEADGTDNTFNITWTGG